MPERGTERTAEGGEAQVLVTGRYRARLAACDNDLRRAQVLRYRAFIAAPAAGRRGGKSEAPSVPPAREGDAHDAICRHVLIEESRTGRLVSCFRVLPLAGGHAVARSYSARHYDLSPLSGHEGPMLEIGRFCVTPHERDPDILRVALGALAKFAQRHRAGLLFGCASFRGADAAAHAEALALIAARHLAPRRWRVGVRAPEVVRFAGWPAPADPKRAFRGLPPMLRSYLALGGWVSDHAVIDRQMDTLHLFAVLEVQALPAARRRRLLALAG